MLKREKALIIIALNKAIRRETYRIRKYTRLLRRLTQFQGRANTQIKLERAVTTKRLLTELKRSIIKKER